jgi:MFS family permease
MFIFQKARWAVNALFLLCGLAFACWASRIPDVKQALNLTDAQLGTVLLAMPMGSLIALPLAGWFIAKFSSRVMVCVAGVFYLVSMWLISGAVSIYGLMGALFIFGFGGDILNISMNVQAVGVEKGYGRNIMSSFHAVFSIGFLLGLAIGGYLAQMPISYENQLFYGGVFTIVSILLVYPILLKTDHKPSEPQPIFAIPDASLLKLAIICFCAMMGEGAMADWGVLYFKQTQGNQAFVSTLASSFFSIAMVLGRLFGDYFTQKYGLSKLLTFNSILYGIGVLCFVLFPQVYTVLLGYLLTGLGVSTLVPMCYAVAGRSKTMAPGSALAAITTVGMVGFLLGPPLIGYISQASNLKFALSVLIVLALVSFFYSKKITD